MKTGTITYTMVDVACVPGNNMKPESYRITLSRGGVNGGTDTAAVDVEASAFESFVDRAKALLRQSGK